MTIAIPIKFAFIFCAFAQLWINSIQHRANTWFQLLHSVGNSTIPLAAIVATLSNPRTVSVLFTHISFLVTERPILGHLRASAWFVLTDWSGTGQAAAVMTTFIVTRALLI